MTTSCTRRANDPLPSGWGRRWRCSWAPPAVRCGTSSAASTCVSPIAYQKPPTPRTAFRRTWQRWGQRSHDSQGDYRVQELTAVPSNDLKGACVSLNYLQYVTVGRATILKATWWQKRHWLEHECTMWPPRPAHSTIITNVNTINNTADWLRLFLVTFYRYLISYDIVAILLATTHKWNHSVTIHSEYPPKVSRACTLQAEVQSAGADL